MYVSHYYVIATTCVEVNFIITSPLPGSEFLRCWIMIPGNSCHDCMVLGSASYFESVKSFISFLM